MCARVHGWTVVEGSGRGAVQLEGTLAGSKAIKGPMRRVTQRGPTALCHDLQVPFKEVTHEGGMAAFAGRMQHTKACRALRREYVPSLLHHPSQYVHVAANQGQDRYRHPGYYRVLSLCVPSAVLAGRVLHELLHCLGKLEP